MARPASGRDSCCPSPARGRGLGRDFSMTESTPQPFTLHVADTALADLRERLGRTRFPDQAPGEPWAYGTNVAWMEGLVAYWRERFDWRAQEARLNRFPQYRTPLHGVDLHFLHVPGKGPNPCPLLLSH